MKLQGNGSQFPETYALRSLCKDCWKRFPRIGCFIGRFRNNNNTEARMVIAIAIAIVTVMVIAIVKVVVIGNNDGNRNSNV